MTLDRDPATDEVLGRLRRHEDPRIRAAAEAAQDAPVGSPGLSRVTPEERFDAARFASRVMNGQPLELAGSVGGLTAARVTAVLKTALERDASWFVAAAAEQVAELPAPFRPDVAGLLGVYASLLGLTDDYYRALWSDEPFSGLPGPAPILLEPATAVALRRVVAWLVSRAGLPPLLVELDRLLGHVSGGDRYVIAMLMVEAAEVADDTRPPDVDAAEPAVAPAGEEVQFTVYRPRAVEALRWYPLIAFVHRVDPFVDDDGAEVDPTAEVNRLARDALGVRAPLYGAVVTDGSAPLPRGNEIVFEPWIRGGLVNPERAAVRWEEPVHKVEFRFRMPARTEGLRLDGGLRVYLGVLLIAELTFTVRVDKQATHLPAPAEPVRGTPYRRIFASYSHRDHEVVARIRAAAAAFGDRYLIDVDDLRAGESWEPRLAELIAQADVFQLFWSQNSMRSPYVRREWEHALSLRREHFVRPVYWENPRPADPEADLPPPALDRLQFCLLRAADTGSAVAAEPETDGYAASTFDVGYDDEPYGGYEPAAPRSWSLSWSRADVGDAPHGAADPGPAGTHVAPETPPASQPPPRAPDPPPSPQWWQPIGPPTPAIPPSGPATPRPAPVGRPSRPVESPRMDPGVPRATAPPRSVGRHHSGRTAVVVAAVVVAAVVVVLLVFVLLLARH